MDGLTVNYIIAVSVGIIIYSLYLVKSSISRFFFKSQVQTPAGENLRNHLIKLQIWSLISKRARKINPFLKIKGWDKGLGKKKK